MALYLQGIDAKGKVFASYGPFEEDDTAGVYDAIETAERIFALKSTMPFYDAVTLNVVRIVHTMEYRKNDQKLDL